MQRIFTSGVAVALAIALTACSTDSVGPASDAPIRTGKSASIASTTTMVGRFELVTSGDVTTVSTVNGSAKTWVATFTADTRTVTMSGDTRTFTENSISVSHNTWVRLLDAPFNGNVDTTWINARLAENTTTSNVKDVLAHAMDYLDAGTLNAKYGPDATTEGSDFNDYLGIDYTYTPHWSTSLNKLVSSWKDGYETSRAGALDCSGYMRMIWGYRMGMTMCFNVNPNDPNGRLPRRSYQLWDNAPGRKVMTDYTWDGSTAATKLEALRVGDLVFFNADTVGTDEKTRVDHVGMYIGRDSSNNMRFIHSRKSDNVGPTFTKDLNGKSILSNDGTGQYLYYVRSLVGARRL